MPKVSSMLSSSTKRKSPYPPSSSGTPLKRKKTTTITRNPDEQPAQTSINDLKRRIRDVKRLLYKSDLPADKRIIQERALKGYEKELADEEGRRERSKMIKKYHFVRFLDRKTATKEVNRLTRQHDELAKSDITEGNTKTKKKELAQLARQIHIAKVNLNYTIYYPLTEKYISIYAEKKQKKKEGGQGTDGDLSDEEAVEAAAGLSAAERTAMWRVVEKCMEEGTLDRLREGKLDVNGERKSKADRSETASEDTTGKKGSKEKVDKHSKPREAIGRQERKTKHAPPPKQEEEDESDGGFFEM
ncbi:hypothetical protein BJY01DRAFT_225278 [Aspergillus pseudoustus]|uniref:rRNA-processing protein EFG1 n=1 Tax=Aspergillus pseudoustus TaxID=1810923 RepID=A0ABR4IZK7_9EURO